MVVTVLADDLGVNGAKGDKGTDKIATEDFAESEVVLESAP